MNSMKSKLKIYCLTALFLTAILTVLRCLSLFFFYSPEIGYFDSSAITVTSNALYVTGAVWLFSPLLFIPKGAISTKFTSSRTSHKSCSSFSAVMFLFAFATSLLSGKLTLSVILTAAAFLAATAFFALSAFGGGKWDTPKAICSLAPTLSLVLVLASIYFDLKIAMNSPHKIVGGIILMTAMVFFLCETRIFLDKPLPRLHFASGLVTFFLGASYALSSVIYLLIASPRAFVAHPITLGNMGYLGVIIGVSVYAASRCLLFGDAEKPQADA